MHKEWRKIAKKIRRQRIRTALAQKREALEKEEEEKRKMSPNYEKRVAEEEAKQIAAREAEMKDLEEKLRKWEEEEVRVREETELRKALLKELEEKNEKQRIEKMEGEQKKVKEEEEKKTRIADCLNNFAGGTIDTLPDDMLVSSETHPGKEMCSFFSKVAACRFWDNCSRNHVRPAVSKTLLFPGFYVNCSMSHIGLAEYDTDISLEVDEKEEYSHFLEFYQDVRSEFEIYGHLTRLLVCCNRESHLRGNVYVCYTTEREAMTAFLKFNGRFYAGRMISCHFVSISNWKSAICGLYFKQKCPKGDACNFLHVFKDPGPPFYEPIHERNSPDGSWRWSLSPEEDRVNNHETNNGSERSYKRTPSTRSSIQHGRSSERRIDNGYQYRGGSREDVGSYNSSTRRRPIESRHRHSSGGSRRSRSRDRDRRYYSDKRNRDKDVNRKSKENENRNNKRKRSRSGRRDRSRDRRMARRSKNKNRTKYSERKRSSSSEVESSSDDDTSSSASSDGNSKHTGNE